MRTRTYASVSVQTPQSGQLTLLLDEIEKRKKRSRASCFSIVVQGNP